MELDERSLFVRLVNHLGREWPDHEVIGFPYAVSPEMWNRGTATVRQRVLETVASGLFRSAGEDHLTVLALGPVMLLPMGNDIPANEALGSLLRITQDTDLPLLVSGFRMLYQRAHVASPLTMGL
jgi:hypothetical protein